MTDFEEFARQFRSRTIARMQEFEKNLEKAQTDVEKAVRQPAQPAQSPPRANKKEARVQGVLRRNSPF